MRYTNRRLLYFHLHYLLRHKVVINYYPQVHALTLDLTLILSHNHLRIL